MKVAYKVWLDNNRKAFGEGPHEMKMSYRKAWTTLKAIETKLCFPLLEEK